MSPEKSRSRRGVSTAGGRKGLKKMSLLREPRESQSGEGGRMRAEEGREEEEEEGGWKEDRRRKEGKQLPLLPHPFSARNVHVQLLHLITSTTL